MKHDHFLDAGSFGLSCAPLEFGDVRVANRAINEASELQMDEALWIGKVYGLPSHGFHHRSRQHVSWVEFHGIPSRLRDPRTIYRSLPETRITSPYREPSLLCRGDLAWFNHRGARACVVARW